MDCLPVSVLGVPAWQGTMSSTTHDKDVIKLLYSNALTAGHKFWSQPHPVWSIPQILSEFTGVFSCPELVILLQAIF